MTDTGSQCRQCEQELEQAGEPGRSQLDMDGAADTIKRNAIH
jgi:hypothetical protein